MTEDNISIIGLEGSGKTVLTTTIVYELNSRVNYPRVEYASKESALYIENNINAIKKGVWPSSTLTGNVERLDFYYAGNSDWKMPIYLFDLAGQDIREIFWNDQPDERLIPIKNKIFSSSCILYTIDILGIIRNFHRRNASIAENFLILDILRKLPRRNVVIVFTKVNNSDLEKHIEDLKQAFPDLYLLLQERRFRHCAISCLDEHHTIDHDGKPVSRPALHSAEARNSFNAHLNTLEAAVVATFEERNQYIEPSNGSEGAGRPRGGGGLLGWLFKRH